MIEHEGCYSGVPLIGPAQPRFRDIGINPPPGTRFHWDLRYDQLLSDGEITFVRERRTGESVEIGHLDSKVYLSLAEALKKLEREDARGASIEYSDPPNITDIKTGLPRGPLGFNVIFSRTRRETPESRYESGDQWDWGL